MSKAARGTKRVCHGCGAKFYDLNNTPIHCPLCGAEYKMTRHAAGDGRGEDVKAAVVPKAARAAAAPIAPELDMELALDPDLAGVEDEDLVSLDDVEEPDVADDEDEAFLPEADEGEDDVSGFLGEGVPKTDEEI